MNIGLGLDADGLLEIFQQQGYVVAKNLIPETTIARVMATALAFPNAQNGTFAPIPMPHRAHPVFLEMMRLPEIVAIVEKLVGGKASGIGGEFFFTRPGMPGFVKHQDNTYVRAPPDAFVSVWTALCDIDEENGCLLFYPGSHKQGGLPTRLLDHMPVVGQNPGAEAVESVLLSEIAPIPMTLKRGSTVFFHGDLVHASRPNSSADRFRYSFLSTYVRSGEPFRPGRLQQRTEVDLHPAGA